MKLLLLLSWLLASVSWCFSGEIKTPWTKICRYVTQHDQVSIVVDTDRWYAVRYPPKSWNIVDAWPEGKELTLSYSENTGAALSDPVTGLRLPLVGWPDDGHPIDLILKQEQSETVTTLDICDSYGRAANRWELEVSRAFNRLATCPESKPAERTRVAAAAKAWKKYKIIYLAGVNATLNRREGSMWSIMAAEHHYTFFREQAMLIYFLLNYAPDDLMAEVTETPPIKS